MRKQIRMITYLPYYHLDAAFDNGLRKDYGNSEIRYDHFYYKEKKLSFTKTEEVFKRAGQAAKKGKPLVFHWRGGYLTRPVLEELVSLIQKAGEEKGKHAQISLNWPQAVIHVTFAQTASVTLEQANEGEEYTDGRPQK